MDGITDADGLAVGRASGLVGSIRETLLDGCYTVDDAKLYPYLTALADSENLYIEPSSCASFPGPALVQQASDYLAVKDLTDSMANAVHILWATGGSMVPKEEMQRYYERGRLLGIARLPCADAQPPRMQHASKQKTKGFLIFMSHSVLCTDRAEVEATFRLLEEENRNNPHIVNGMMAPRYLSYDMDAQSVVISMTSKTGK